MTHTARRLPLKKRFNTLLQFTFSQVPTFWVNAVAFKYLLLLFFSSETLFILLFQIKSNKSPMYKIHQMEPQQWPGSCLLGPLLTPEVVPKALLGSLGLPREHRTSHLEKNVSGKCSGFGAAKVGWSSSSQFWPLLFLIKRSSPWLPPSPVF